MELKHTTRVYTNIDDVLYLPLDSQLVAADVETYKTDPTDPASKLLGLSLTWEGAESLESAYFAFWSFKDGKWTSHISIEKSIKLRDFLRTKPLIGWNATYDKKWLDSVFNVTTVWNFDVRIMWHLSNNDETIRGYGLKLAQKKLLGWKETNEDALADHIKTRGGSINDGDHYLSDLDVLAHYAMLDTVSTIEAYRRLVPWFNKNDYLGFASYVGKYAQLLQKSTSQGIPANKEKIEEARDYFFLKRFEAHNEVLKSAENEIKQIEEAWKTEDSKRFKKEANRIRFLNSSNSHRKFNPASGEQRALLLHKVLGLPVSERTPTGKAKTDRGALALLSHPIAKHLLDYSEYKKLYEMACSYLAHVKDNRIHPPYDICGTVSGRLGGFAPYVLNMPFSEVELMKSFECEPGYVGIHADLAAIEPCMIANFSDDPGLLKVYKDGVGDIYLDLALELFPDNKDLQDSYNANAILDVRMKEKFKDERAIAKIIHLAVSYTGTRVTVAKNLTKAGFPTTQEEAGKLVWRYWQKFRKVKEFDRKLQSIYEDQGFLRNPYGRIIQVPTMYKKDLMNRLIQSSGHDILVDWVFNICTQFEAVGIDFKYWLPDIHDSVTLMVRKEQKEQAKEIYVRELDKITKKLNLDVHLRCEVKEVSTLAGLKNRE